MKEVQYRYEYSLDTWRLSLHGPGRVAQRLSGDRCGPHKKLQIRCFPQLCHGEFYSHFCNTYRVTFFACFRLVPSLWWPPIKIASYSPFLFIRRAALNWAMWCDAGAASTASTLAAWARRRSQRRPLAAAAARRRGRRSDGGARTVWPESIPASSASCRREKLFPPPLLARYWEYHRLQQF
jgi:hypothetical protein